MSIVKHASVGFAAGMLGALVMVAGTGASAEQRPKTKARPKATAAAPSEVLEAREFRLVDSAGTMRGTWHADDDGSTTLTMVHEGKPTIMVSVQANGTPAVLLKGENKTSASLIVLRGTTPALSLKHPNGTIDVAVSNENRPSVEIRDSTEKVLFQSNR